MTVDSLGFVDSLRGFPEQLARAHEDAAHAVDLDRLPRPDYVRHVVVCGMGGSGIVGDVVASVGAAAMSVPITVLREYEVPAWIGPETLVFAVSYSGSTEETLTMAGAVLDAGAAVVGVSAGGPLAELVRSRGGLHLPCPPGIPAPRVALGAMIAPVLVTLFRLGLFPEAHAGLVRAQEQLVQRRDVCVPEVESPRNPARELARRIDRTVPIVYGTGRVGACAAMRWKQSMNENAKAPAFWNWYPELTHNEICGWGQHGDLTRQVFTLIELEHGLENARLVARAAIARDMIEEAVAQTLRVEAMGEGPLAQLLDLIYLGDWTACYVALANDVDPGPIDAIATLKAALDR